MKPDERAQRLRIDTVHGRHLQNNRLSDPVDRNLSILLPRSYCKSATRRYPVVYILHGFNGTAWRWAEDFSISSGPKWRSFLHAADDLMKGRRCQEMILVAPDGHNRWGCGQWVDSGINGNYASYVADDIVSYVDSHYRTIPKRSHRLVTGVSSGGIGSFHVGGSFPEVFGAVAMRSADIYFEVTHVPWLVDFVNASWPMGFDGPIRANGNSWFCYGLAAAYSPNSRKAPYYCDLPIRFPTAELDEKVWEKWLHFDPIRAYKRYVKAFRSMHVFHDCGSQDEFDFHLGHRILHERLKKARVKHLYEEYDGTHGNLSTERTLRAIQWFNKLLPLPEKGVGRAKSKTGLTSRCQTRAKKK